MSWFEGQYVLGDAWCIITTLVPVSRPPLPGVILHGRENDPVLKL